MIKKAKIIILIISFLGSIVLYGILALFLNSNENKILFYIAIFMLIILLVFSLLDFHKGMSKWEKSFNKLFICLLLISGAMIYFSNNVIGRLYIGKEEDQDLIMHLILEDKKEYNEKFKTYEYKGNEIYYVDNQESILKLLETYIDNAREYSKRIYGDMDIDGVNIKLDYDEDIFKRRTKMKNVSGYYIRTNKTIYLLANENNIFNQWIREFSLGGKNETILLHEYNHHLFYEFLRDNKIDTSKVPTWFIEGLAEYMANKGDGSTYDIDEFVCFDKLNTNRQWEQVVSNDTWVYAQSHYAIDKLIRENKEKVVIKEILLNLKKYDFNTALEMVTGKSFKVFEKELKDDFENDWIEHKNNVREPRYILNKDWILVKDILEEYLKFNSKDEEAYIYLSNIYRLNLNDVEKSIEVLRRAVENIGKSKKILNQLANIYEEIGEYELENKIKIYIKEK